MFPRARDRFSSSLVPYATPRHGGGGYKGDREHEPAGNCRRFFGLGVVWRTDHAIHHAFLEAEQIEKGEH